MSNGTLRNAGQKFWTEQNGSLGRDSGSVVLKEKRLFINGAVVESSLTRSEPLFHLRSC